VAGFCQFSSANHYHIVSSLEPSLISLISKRQELETLHIIIKSSRELDIM